MSVIQIHIVVLVTLFCFVNLVSCDSYSWGYWRAFIRCQQTRTGMIHGLKVEARWCHRVDDNGVAAREIEWDCRKCGKVMDELRIKDCSPSGVEPQSYVEKYLFTKHFHYPCDTPGSNKGTPFKFTLPVDGCYRISATGASGDGSFPAKGATATGVFKLNSGLELTIVVGKHGKSGGGGGGTFVYTVTKDNTRGDLYVVGGGAGHRSCRYEGDINCQYNGQDGEDGGGFRGGTNGGGGGCDFMSLDYPCSYSGAGWWSPGCGDCFPSGKSFEDGFAGGTGGGYGGGGDIGGGGYSGGSEFYIGSGGGGSFVNSKASHSNKHKNPPTSDKEHGTASVELVDDNQC